MKSLKIIALLFLCPSIYGQTDYNFKYVDSTDDKRIILEFELNKNNWEESILEISNKSFYQITNSVDSISIKFITYDISKIKFNNRDSKDDDYLVFKRFKTFFQSNELERENATFTFNPSNQSSKYVYNTENYYFISYNFFDRDIMVSVKITKGENGNKIINCDLEKILDSSFFNSKVQFINE